MNINLEYQIMKKGHMNRTHTAEMEYNYANCWCVCHGNLIKVWKLS